jgi:protoheme IX farnesyltransferase
MLWYTLILVPVTLLPVAFGAFGVIYLVSAAALGAWLLAQVVTVLVVREWSAPSWRLYKFSLLYLALLFLAMAIDRAIAR